MIEYVPFPKLPRLSRDVTISEKIDGTNACVYVPETGAPQAGSRTRWITPEDDNAGFARWVQTNSEELLTLGPGMHFGEWWGSGIQRNYSQTKKRFSLFNTYRWSDANLRPGCCDVVPVLFEGPMESYNVLVGVKSSLKTLQDSGSAAAPGFMSPEGIVIYHHASGQYFKKTLLDDEAPKSRS